MRSGSEGRGGDAEGTVDEPVALAFTTTDALPGAPVFTTPSPPLPFPGELRRPGRRWREVAAESGDTIRPAAMSKRKRLAKRARCPRSGARDRTAVHPALVCSVVEEHGL
jgi:hypothetical protein